MNEKATVDPKVLEFFSRLGIEFLDIDTPGPSHEARWRRTPIMQGEEGSYEFRTPAGMAFDSYFHLALIDSVFESGFREGQAALRRDFQRLLRGAKRGSDDRNRR